MNHHIKRAIQIFILSAGIISILLTAQTFIQLKSNRDKAAQTAVVLLNQVESVISKNDEDSKAVLVELKDNYVTRAKLVAYILSINKKADYNLDELNRVAELAMVDEIHFFDKSGKLYGGTVPIYYGYTMDSDERMAYFKPMLTDTNKIMCQDLTLNTSDGKPMMYAMVWREDKSSLVQVGIEPILLLGQMQDNDIKEVVYDMPTYDGVQIIVATRKDALICGATDESLLYKHLSDVGIDIYKHSTDSISHFLARIAGRQRYCTLHEHGDYYIAILHDYKVINQSVGFTVLIVFVYLFLAAVLIILIVRRMTIRIIAEEERANRDKMTGLLNRRAYENVIAEQSAVSLASDFVFVMADLNGLKVTNDTLGHGAGDELIQGAASCLTQCFGAYGDVYRIGGDEFVAMIYADSDILTKIKTDLDETVRKWDGTLVHSLSMSYGYVERREFPNMTIGEIVKVADKRMYIAKKEYYAREGINRRH